MARLSLGYVVLFIVCGMLLSLVWRQQPPEPFPTTAVVQASTSLEPDTVQGIDNEIARWTSQIEQGLLASTELRDQMQKNVNTKEVRSIPRQQMANIVKPSKPPPKPTNMKAYIRHTQSIATQSGSLPPPTTSKGKKRLTFIKTYKTGSTTLAMFINSLSYQLNLKMLHPLESGWFKEGEIMSRAKKGSYDVSYRHLSPHLDYVAMNALLPNCLFVSILREPVSRFVSLFNFVKTLRVKYKTAQAFVENVRKGLVPVGDASSFCNNMAWVVAGIPLSETLASVDFDGKTQESFQKVLKIVQQRKVVMLMSNEMDESMVLLSYLMDWDLQMLKFADSTERVQTSKVYKCSDEECRAAILSCNGVDSLLYNHFESIFPQEKQKVPDFEARLQAFTSKKQATRPGDWAKKYPINCKKKSETRFEQLHGC